VIAPFRAQVALLQKIIASDIDKDVEVNTVDQYQGRDKDVIIFSCTKTESITSACTKSLPAKNKVYLKFLQKLCLTFWSVAHKDSVDIGQTCQL
jgi:Superfamily I DNA and RNA helicases and helicase subunits